MLLNIVYFLLIISNLLKYLQEETLKIIVYIYNKIPYSNINFILLYKAKIIIKPNLGNIKIQGFTVYYKIKDINLFKLNL